MQLEALLDSPTLSQVLPGGLRPAQRAVLGALSEGDVLALLPTGAGKSACYWLPALQGVPTLVITPLRALMADQLAHLPSTLRVAARVVHAALPPASRREAWSAWREGRARLLFMAPEGLPAGETSLAARPPALVAVDEAHCAVTWGAEFRPAYQELRRLRERWPATWLALTASADRSMADSVVSALGLRRATVVRQDPDRPEINWRVFRAEPLPTRLERMSRLRATGAGIVYVGRRALATPLADRLSTAGMGRVRSYHALQAASLRQETELAWLQGRCDVMVATVAFGLGVDRPDVRWVCTWAPPRRWEDLWQQAGRAGRDGEPAIALCWGEASRDHDQVMHTYLGAGACRRAVLLRALAAGWDMPWRHGPAVGVAAPPRRLGTCCDRCDGRGMARAA